MCWNMLATKLVIVCIFVWHIKIFSSLQIGELKSLIYTVIKNEIIIIIQQYTLNLSQVLSQHTMFYLHSNANISQKSLFFSQYDQIRQMPNIQTCSQNVRRFNHFKSHAFVRPNLLQSRSLNANQFKEMSLAENENRTNIQIKRFKIFKAQSLGQNNQFFQDIKLSAKSLSEYCKLKAQKIQILSRYRQNSQMQQPLMAPETIHVAKNRMNASKSKTALKISIDNDRFHDEELEQGKQNKSKEIEQELKVETIIFSQKKEEQDTLESQKILPPEITSSEYITCSTNDALPKKHKIKEQFGVAKNKNQFYFCIIVAIFALLTGILMSVK